MFISSIFTSEWGRAAKERDWGNEHKCLYVHIDSCSNAINCCLDNSIITDLNDCIYTNLCIEKVQVYISFSFEPMSSIKLNFNSSFEPMSCGHIYTRL